MSRVLWRTVSNSTLPPRRARRLAAAECLAGVVFLVAAALPLWAPLWAVEEPPPISATAKDVANNTAANKNVLGENAENLENKIARLIEKLGAEEYASREQAQAELALMGLAAFDALNHAREHTDVEIALRAKYLVRSMRVEWALEDDPTEVRQIFQNYDSQPESDRRSRMELLSRLDNWAGGPALVRLAKYERSRQLSKHAALLLMNREAPENEEARLRLAGQLRQGAGGSRRTAARWVRALADTLESPAEALDVWGKLIDQERELFARFPDKSSADIVRDLSRWQADELEKAGRNSEALEAMRQSLALLPAQTSDLIEAIDWLLERKAWSVVQEVAGRFPQNFGAKPELLYRLAQSHLGAGEIEKSEQVADQAFNALKDNRLHRAQMGRNLAARGLFKWAEREYRDTFDPEAEKQAGVSPKRNVLPLAPRDSEGLLAIKAREYLADMLHDQLKVLEAAKVLQPLADAAQKQGNADRLVDPAFLRRVQGSMHFYYSQHYANVDVEKQKKHLKLAVGFDSNNADILIAMYRVKNADEAWKKSTKALIEQTAAHFHALVVQFREQFAGVDEIQQPSMASALAVYDNQYAWLVANTEGDLQDALAASLEGNKMSPNRASSLDTLGRCYFAVGDLKNAIKTQREAVRLDPHTGAISRQLKFFESQAAAD